MLTLFIEGALSGESLYGLFHSKTGPQEPFWTNVQHLAFAMREVDVILEYDDNKECSSWCLEELQQFPCLRTFTLVLDPIERGSRWPPRINGTITFEKTRELTQGKHHQRGGMKQWAVFSKRLFYGIKDVKPDWNAPEFLIKSLSRGGRLQIPDWTSYEAASLIERIHDETESSNSESEEEEEDSDLEAEDISEDDSEEEDEDSDPETEDISKDDSQDDSDDDSDDDSHHDQNDLKRLLLLYLCAKFL